MNKTMNTVSKSFTFDAAHRLGNGYVGKCANVHGHTWEVCISVKAEALDAFGFVVDFSDLKQVKDWVDEHWDHAMLVAETDHAMQKFLFEHNQKHAVIHGNPTSEILCKTLCDVACSMGFDVSEISISETPTSKATLN